MLNIVVLAIFLKCGTAKYSVVHRQSLGGLPRAESSTCLVSVMGKHRSQSVAKHYGLNNGRFYSFLLP